MKDSVPIRLQELRHQLDAINAVVSTFRGVTFNRNSGFYANPLVINQREEMQQNITSIQDGNVPGLPRIPLADRGNIPGEPLGIDVKMETGTGKTYTYTRLMYEMHQQFGFHKFILLVPSAPIRSGTEEFMNSDYAREHFSDIYDRSDLRLNVLKSEPKPKRRGRSMLPRAVERFAGGMRLNERRFDILLMTGSMLASKTTMEKEYEQAILHNQTVPYEILAATRPVVIIDEPHRFTRSQTWYKTMLDKLDPQLIIRFGATFPRKIRGRGKNKTTNNDYNNLVFDLTAVEAFNRNLVKGIHVDIPSLVQEASTQFKLARTSATKPKSATFIRSDNKKSPTLYVGDSLTALAPEFAGITLDDITKVGGETGVVLSNGREVSKADRLVAGVYSETYQSIMLEQAIRNHLEQEWENFNRQRRIKTLTLFFIDSVYSYRKEDNSPGQLRLEFEKLLCKHTHLAIEKHSKSSSKRAQEYVAFLQASLQDISATSGGYFAVDNSTKNAAIEAEVNEILKDKQSLLAFSREDGSWHTRRFIFSKWTLKEGWDNPNVFQIAKLRSSGSEISKLQEVGRGLRLPVDEDGDRISSEDFFLTYLVDGTEEEFAQKLVGEINSELPEAWNIKADLKDAARQRNVSEEELFIELLTAKLISTDGDVLDGKYQELEARYPEFQRGLKAGKVTNKKEKIDVHINPDNFNKLADLWESVNKKFVISFDELSTEQLDAGLDEILSDDIYQESRSTVLRQTIRRSDGIIDLQNEIRDHVRTHSNLPYGVFLQHAHESTKLPLDVLHRGFIRLNAEAKLPADFFNHRTLARLNLAFQKWFRRTFETRYSFHAVEHRVFSTALTDANNSPKKSIPLGRVGKFVDAEQATPRKFLYQEVVYDASHELANIIDSNSATLDDKIVVFGKIPTRSIQVPLYFGGTTSPDFMYVLKKPDGSVHVNLIIETKSVASIDEATATDEKRRIKAAQKFFDKLQDAGLDVTFKSQDHETEIVDLIRKLV